jgi:hypothetical protein
MRHPSKGEELEAPFLPPLEQRPTNEFPLVLPIVSLQSLVRREA